MLNREPKLFEHVKVLIDIFHKLSNHKCGECWDIRKYEQHNQVNTEAQEQLNSFLGEFRSQCAYMKQTTFMKFIAIILGVRNLLKIKKDQ